MQTTITKGLDKIKFGNVPTKEILLLKDTKLRVFDAFSRLGAYVVTRWALQQGGLVYKADEKIYFVAYKIAPMKCACVFRSSEKDCWV